ncbi:MAG: AlpA family phage regulatory protein [bacterium]|nr:AlpA family phage regulatory protein [bacterium]
MATDESNSSTVLRIRDVCNRLGICRQTLQRWRDNGSFPAPIILGPRTVGWTVAALDEWIRNRPHGNAAVTPPMKREATP